MQVGSSRIHIAVLLAVALAPVFAVLHLGAEDVLAELTVEDGIIEYVQAALFLFAAIAFGVVAWRLRGKSPWAGPLALGMFFIAGEEISWGQRILGLSTPASFEESNVQGELNLHNLEGIHGSIRAVGVLLVIVLFIVIPIAYRVSPAIRGLLARGRAPQVPLDVVPLALVALAFMIVPRILTGVVFQLDEIGELYLALSAAAFGLGALSGVVERPVNRAPVRALLAE